MPLNAISFILPACLVAACVVPTSFAAGRAERNAAVDKVVEFHSQATESLNDLSGAIEALKVATGKMAGEQETLRKTADSAAEISLGLSKLSRDIMSTVAAGGKTTAFDEARQRGYEARENLKVALKGFERTIADAKKEGDEALRRAGDSLGKFDEAIKGASRARFLGGSVVKEADERNNELAFANIGSRDRLSKSLADAKSAYSRAIEEFLKAENAIQAKMTEAEQNLGNVDLALTNANRPQVVQGVVTNLPEKSYSVQFFFDEVEFHKQTGQKGEKVSKPSDEPKRQYCDFLYWSSEKNGGAKYEGFGTDGLGAGAPMALYAVFGPEKAGVVSFWLDKGKSRLFERREYMRSQRKPLEKPAKGNPEAWGCRFVGWSEDGGKTISEAFGLEMADDRRDFVAKWEETPVRVEFFVFGADGKARKVEEKEAMLSEPLPETCPEEPGYEFRSWGVAKEAKGMAEINIADIEPAVGGTYAENQAKLNDGGGVAHLFAMRDAIQHIATFASWDGQVLAVATGSVEKAVSAPVAPDVPGYSFKGWLMASGESYADGPLVEDISVAASYSPIRYTAKIHFPDGTESEAAYTVEEPLDVSSIPLKATSTRISHSLSLDTEGKPMRPVPEGMIGDVDIYVVKSARFRFKNNAQTLCERDVAVGSVLIPPRLRDKATGEEIKPVGWAPWSNFTPIDLDAPMTEERLENRDIEHNLFYDGAMQLFPIWGDLGHRPEVEAID